MAMNEMNPSAGNERSPRSSGQAHGRSSMIVPGDAVKKLTLMLAEEHSDAEHVDETTSVLDKTSFQGCVGFLVVSNCVLMGVEVDYPEWTEFWYVAEYVFTVAFAMEMILKLCILRGRYFSDRWNWLDGVLVLLACVDLWIITPMGSNLDMQALSVFRILRLARLVRVLRLFKALKRFVLVLTGILDALRATFWVGSLMVVCIFVSAIFCTTLVGRGPVDRYPGYTKLQSEMDDSEVMANFNPYMSFGSMGRSMLTLFNIAILSEWVEVIRPISEKQPSMVAFFVLFALFVCYGVMNVIIGMIVESVIQHAKEIQTLQSEQELNGRLSRLQEISALADAVDRNHDGKVSLKEMEASMQLPAMTALLKHLKVPLGLTGAELLAMLDEDGDEALHFEEIMRSFYRLVDSNDFQRLCIHQIGVGKLKQRVNVLNEVSTETLQLVRQLHDLVLELKCDLHHAMRQNSSQSPYARAHGDCSSMAVEGANRPCTRQPVWKDPAPETADGNVCWELELRIAEALEQVQRLDEVSAEGVAKIAGAAARAEFADYLTEVERSFSALIHDSVHKVRSHPMGVELELAQGMPVVARGSPCEQAKPRWQPPWSHTTAALLERDTTPRSIHGDALFQQPSSSPDHS